MDLNKEIQYIKGVGPTRAKLLNKIGIYTLNDLITYFPREYEDRSNPKNIAELENGEEALLSAYPVGRVNEIRIRGNLTLDKLTIRDETGTAQVVWYNQPYLKTIFKPNQRYKFYGKVKNISGRIELQSPVYELEENTNNTGKIIPIYPLTYNLTQNVIRKIIENGLKEVNDNIPETMPQYFIEKYGLYDLNTAIEQIHFPENFENFEKARKRLVFEELLSMQLSLLSLKNKYGVEKEGISFKKSAKMSDVINKLPFSLTKAQTRVLEEIDNDMEKSKPMNRLLQGDVGSGKTIVALIACYKAVKSGYQAVVMAPTAILASQHLESFTEILKDFGINCELLISGISKKKKEDILERLSKRKN